MSIDVTEIERLLKVLQRYGVAEYELGELRIALRPLGGYDALEADDGQEEPTSSLEEALRKGRAS